MEESGKTIREDSPDPPMEDRPSWLCDEQDKPVTAYIHENDHGRFRLKIGGAWWERFDQNTKGEWLYRRAR